MMLSFAREARRSFPHSFSISTHLLSPILSPNPPLSKLGPIRARQNSKSLSSTMSANQQILKPRTVIKKVVAKEQAEGEGATVRRSIGRMEHRSLDPFLMLDYATVAAPARFPFHPHRGIETVTYGLEGEITHEDFNGRKGVIRPGDVQWMTAGRGIVHAGKPIGDVPNRNFQLWVNLSSKDKMIEPVYQEIQSKDIKRVERDGIEARVIAGEAFGVRSPIFTRTPTMYLDLTMSPGSELRQPIPEGWNAFFYVIEGEGVFGDPSSSPVSGHHNLVLGDGDGVAVWNNSDRSLRFLLIAGQPVNEPVVQYGPFVMNTRHEIEKAFEDYQLCKNGFEMAKHLKD